VVTLYSKLVAALLGLFAIVVLLCIYTMPRTYQMYQQEVSQKLNRDLAAHLAKDRNLISNGVVNKQALEEIFRMYMEVNPSIEIYLLDHTGKILAYSAPAGTVKEKSVSLKPIGEFLGKDTAFPIAGDNPRHPGSRKAFSVAPITRNHELQGYLYIILGGDRYDSAAGMISGSYILKNSFWAGTAALGVLLALGLLLFALLTRRLTRLTRVLERFGKSDFNEPVTFPANQGAFRDEIDCLGVTFNQMADRIIDQVGRLKSNDNLRRELVANVSHDLRTPLASLQGYLETLLIKDTTLSSKEKQQYLQIAIKHSQRLSRLVADLFELAKLDAHEIKPHFERFSLGDLLQDVIMKFKLAAEEKGVSVEARVDPEVQFVLADIGLVERVLDNLIDNALRYTPAGGRVSIEVEPLEEHIRVRVCDTGSGIPAANLPHIFDRFYRYRGTGDESFDGAGLGLAITKRIVELHGSTIEARSEPNAGTTFSFSLPLTNAA
jgi:two-component system OmpR family sensor kinase